MKTMIVGALYEVFSQDYSGGARLHQYGAKSSNDLAWLANREIVIVLSEVDFRTVYCDVLCRAGKGKMHCSLLRRVY